MVRERRRPALLGAARPKQSPAVAGMAAEWVQFVLAGDGVAARGSAV